MIKLGSIRHRWFYVSVALGVAGGLAMLAVARDLAFVAGANLFFAAYLVLTAFATRKLDAAFLKRHADQEDAPALVILFVMVAAVAASTVSLVIAMMGKGGVPVQLVLGVVAVVLGWFSIHTMWAMHYAFEYYRRPEASPAKGGRADVIGGLEFPGGEAPDGMAFLYFSYVIGMTAQTSDTAVTSNAMRRLVIYHGVFSFFFNTVIVAAAVNIVVSIGR